MRLVLSMLLFLTAILSHSISLASQQIKPNIVFILLDDLDATTTRPYYDKVMPHTMALLKQGIEFKNSFVTTPLCCPSRASILSGRYGHNTNVLGNGGPRGGWAQFRDDEPLALPNLLLQQGYRTALIGKYLNGYNTTEKRGSWSIPPRPIGFSDGAVLVSKNLKKYKGYNYHLLNWDESTQDSLEYRGEKESDYSTDVVRDKTLAFLDKAKTNPTRPFFAYVNPTCPHFPLPPAPRHQKLADQLWGYQTFPMNRGNIPGQLQDIESYLENKPHFLKKTFDKRIDLFQGGGKFLEWMGARLPKDAPEHNIGAHQVDWHNRMGSLMACDEMVRDIVAKLKSNGQWSNTLLVFTSDNGYNLGAHGLNQKLSPYEEAIRVPTYLLAGENVAIDHSARSLEHWVLNIDFTPTLIDLVTGAVPTNMDGKSMLPLLKGNPIAAKQWRTKFLIEYWGPGLANGYLHNMKFIHYRLMPAYLMDVPSFNALRFMGDEGDSWLYTSWEHYPRRLGNDKDARDHELYNISEDRFQLHNLLPNNMLQNKAEQQMQKLLTCAGQTGPQSCLP